MRSLAMSLSKPLSRKACRSSHAGFRISFHPKKGVKPCQVFCSVTRSKQTPAPRKGCQLFSLVRPLISADRPATSAKFYPTVVPNRFHRKLQKMKDRGLGYSTINQGFRSSSSAWLPLGASSISGVTSSMIRTVLS